MTCNYRPPGNVIGRAAENVNTKVVTQQAECEKIIDSGSGYAPTTPSTPTSPSNHAAKPPDEDGMSVGTYIAIIAVIVIILGAASFLFIGSKKSVSDTGNASEKKVGQPHKSESQTAVKPSRKTSLSRRNKKQKHGSKSKTRR